MPTDWTVVPESVTIERKPKIHAVVKFKPTKMFPKGLKLFLRWRNNGIERKGVADGSDPAGKTDNHQKYW